MCFCEENTGDWTLVPQYFSGNEVYKEIIPTLILKSFPENISRVLTYEEEEFLNLKNLEKEKKAKEIKINELQRKKDLIFFQTKTEAEKHKASMEIENQLSVLKSEIQEIQRKISEPTIYKQENFNIKIDESFVDEKFLENFQAQEKVNAVLSGSVTEQNGFLFVKARITVLAKNPFFQEVSYVGNYSEVQEIASNIVEQLFAFVINKKNVSISVKVFPEEISKNSSITIDGKIYKSKVDKVLLQQGEHKITVESPGYESRIFTAFLDDSHESYSYSVYLEPKVPEKIEIFVDTEKIDNEEDFISNSSLYVGGIKQPILNDENAIFSSVLVEKSPVLGEFVLPLVTGTDEEKEYASTFFRLTGELEKPIVPKLDSSTSLIEKARKRMYNSYGIFLLTLPFTFYANGRLTDITNRINSGLYTEDMLAKYNAWKVTSGISIGVSVSAGINMLVQLGRYIYTANTVLPQE